MSLELDAPLPSPGPRARLHRDRATWLIYAQLGVYGYFLYAFSPSVPLLGADEHVSKSVAALHGTALALGAMLAGAINARLSRRLGRPGVMSLGAPILALGAMVYISVPVLPVSLLGAAIAALGGSLIVATSGALLQAHHGPLGPAAITEANGLAAAAGLLAPAAVGACVAFGVGWRTALLLVVPLAVAIMVAARRTTDDRGAGAARHEADAPGRMPLRFWPAWLCLMFGVGTEFATTIWSSQLVQQRTSLGEGAAAACVSAVVGGMAAGRFGGGWLAAHVPTDLLLVGSLAVCVGGFVPLWLTHNPVVAVISLAVVGLGISVQYPLSIGRMLRLSQHRTDRAAGLGSLAAGAASGLAPFALGALADTFGVHDAFLVVPALQVLALVAVVLSRQP